MDKPITYISTRGLAPELGFEAAVLTGLATDGGLYVPRRLPRIAPHELAEWAQLPYAELAFRVIAPFVGDAIPETDLHRLLEETYAGFRHAAVAPLVQTGHNRYILELFHGPTLAFKDFALQFLGRLLDYFLTRRGERITIVGATSGDTGSAAIAGCGGRKNMDIFILHPAGRVSEVQRRQMTTVQDANVHNIALQGTFDDCQDTVKALFADEAFRTKHRLVAVNSINWARILAQVVYYFHAALALGAPARAVSFSVPTGNFGDIYAGHIARSMGLPIDRLVIATNRNDILTRCLHSGRYEIQETMPSLSPSMDIQISSNFERLLFELHGHDGAKIRDMMASLREKRVFSLSESVALQLRKRFASASADDGETLAAITSAWQKSGYLADPHTAVGMVAADKTLPQDKPVVTLATAHPAKFPEAVERATGLHPALPRHLAGLMDAPERYDTLPARDLSAVQGFIERQQSRA